MAGTYEQMVDRESAYEKLAQRGAAGATGGPAQAGAPGAAAPAESGGLLGDVLNWGKEALVGRTGPRGGQYDGMVQTVVKGEMRRMGRELLRGALGSLLGGRKR